MDLLLLLRSSIFCLALVHAEPVNHPQHLPSPSTISGKLLELGLIESKKDTKPRPLKKREASLFQWQFKRRGHPVMIVHEEFLRRNQMYREKEGK
jgi:hypothetical protein